MVSANAHEFRRGANGHDPHDAFLLKPVELNGLLDTLASQLGLEWLSDTPEPGIPEVSNDGANDLAGALPAAADRHLDEIARLARIGHMRGLQAEIAALEQAVPAAAQVVAMLRQQLDAFDFRGLQATISRVASRG
jgi:hypothetical protein